MTSNVPPLSQQPSPRTPATSWREAALARSEVISDAWEVTKTYAGRIAEWVLFGCMVMNILEILVTLPSALSNIVLGTQVVMLDVGGFSLASMGEQARQQGDEAAARKASVTGNFLIGVTIVTLLLVTIGLLWSAAKHDTDMAEKGLILVRVIMTVIYGHVIHSLRSVATHRQHATFSEHLTELATRLTESEQRITEHYTELVERTASELAAHFTEHPALSELAHLAETVEMHSRRLTELVALPGLFEQLQQEMQAALAAHTEQHRTPPNTTRPKLSVVEAHTEQHRTANSTPKTNSSESDKGAFVRRCLSETPNIRNTDIQRKAREQGITISPAYISEIRKAFLREQTA